ncbi:MAG: transglutaminase TgpA family protein [Marmoricola sp.]
MNHPIRTLGWPEDLLVSLVAMLAGWAALWSWAPLVARPHRFLLAALVAGAVIVGLGALGRRFRVPAALVVVVQALGCTVWFSHHFAVDHGIGSWLPTPDRLHNLASLVRQGTVTINHYTSPVPVQFTEVVVFLAVGGALMLLAVDLFVCGLRRPSLAALPILLTLTIPISVLVERLALPVFVVTALLFLVLLAWQQHRRVRSWGREVGRGGVRRHLHSLLTGAAAVAVVAIGGALLLPGLVPVSHGIALTGPGGHDNGDRANNVTVANPLINIRRDLLRRTHTPMLTARTNAPDPSYLRLAVLDQFTGDQWRPSTRQLPSGNDADGPLPQAPGLTNAVPGVQTQWRLHLARNFETSWLPTPYPANQIKVAGDWRYDSTTLDVTNVGKPSASEGLRYDVDAFAPHFGPQLLRLTSVEAPPSIQVPMTRLPAGLPPVIRRVAKRVVRGAHSEYARAVALQDWFRRDGGFTYSTEAGPGSGMQLIADFITHGKVGYCEQFATAMAVMGRTLGIPARVVVGFVHPKRVGPDTYRYTSDNLHAWPEFYFDGAGWVRFEPTPAVRTGRAPAYTRPQQQATAPTPPKPLPAPTHTTLPQLQTQAGQHHGQRATAEVPGWVVALVVLVLAAGLALVPYRMRSRRRRRWLAAGQPPAAFAHGAWQELRATSIDHGLPWPAQRSPRETLHRLQGRVAPEPDLARSLAGLCSFEERARYASRFEPTAAEQQHVRETVLAWSAAVRRGAPDRTRRRARWLPRSVFGQ